MQLVWCRALRIASIHAAALRKSEMLSAGL
jgi:hypothetical protein